MDPLEGQAAPDRLSVAQNWLKDRFPGVLLCLTIAAAAQFLASHYGAPQMLFALLLGMAFHFTSEEKSCAAGVEFAESRSGPFEALQFDFEILIL